ncbi:uncharacterized protein LOC119357954 [Triticum dicoccoides]|uniref:uncharacterized protein LOC119357954 n=1 Tax=Triticum dicoccoides TaxID=85692 RepID=UPI00188E5D1A|nr:uncharacterized protein LOC119357954 [Triticum dicoccoides]
MGVSGKGGVSQPSSKKLRAARRWPPPSTPAPPSSLHSSAARLPPPHTGQRRCELCLDHLLPPHTNTPHRWIPSVERQISPALEPRSAGPPQLPSCPRSPSTAPELHSGIPLFTHQAPRQGFRESGDLEEHFQALLAMTINDQEEHFQ